MSNGSGPAGRPPMGDVDFERSPFLVIWETTQYRRVILQRQVAERRAGTGDEVPIPRTVGVGCSLADGVGRAEPVAEYFGRRISTLRARSLRPDESLTTGGKM